MVHILLLNLDDRGHGLVPRDVLSPEEKERAGGYRFDEDRNRFINGRLWMRHLLATRLEVRPTALTVEEISEQAPIVRLNGNPIPLSWNFSRSGALGLFAVSERGRLGVDLEVVRPIPEAMNVAEDMFSPAELQRLRSTPENERNALFLWLWTAKEALVKAVGTGLTEATREFTVAFGEAGQAEVKAGPPPFESGAWELHCLGDGSGWCGMVATDQRPVSFSLQDLRS